MLPVPPRPGKRSSLSKGLDAEHPHPVQKAFIDEQTFQCGYCLNGWVLTAKALLDKNPHPTDEQMASAFEESGLPLRQPRPNRGRRAVGGESVTMPSSIGASRRGFLKAAAVSSIGFSFLDSRGSQPFAAETSANPAPGRLDAWLRVGETVTFAFLPARLILGWGM